MPCELSNFVIAFAPLFSKPVFVHVKILVVGAILPPVSRTVTTALRVIGLSQEKHFENYHRVLNRDQWSSLRASRILLNRNNLAKWILTLIRYLKSKHTTVK
jgi:hypothetical protein